MVTLYYGIFELGLHYRDMSYLKHHYRAYKGGLKPHSFYFIEKRNIIMFDFYSILR